MPPERLSRLEAPEFGGEVSLPASADPDTAEKSPDFGGGIKSYAVKSENYGKSISYVAVLRGRSERVSAAKFPDPRENTGNFPRNVPPRLHEALRNGASLDEFPAIETGNFFRQTGKNIAPNSELGKSAW